MTDVQRSRILWLVSLALFILIAGYTILAIGVSQALSNAAENTHRIDVNAFAACTDLNRGFARSNGVINRGIATEEAKPHPDQAQLKSLRDFRLPIRDCGVQP